MRAMQTRKRVMSQYDKAWDDFISFFDNLYMFPEVEDLLQTDYSMDSETKIKLITDALEVWKGMCDGG